MGCGPNLRHSNTRRHAQVVVFNGLSAHADRNDLLAYVRAITPAPQQVFVVHGEGKNAGALLGLPFKPNIRIIPSSCPPKKAVTTSSEAVHRP